MLLSGSIKKDMSRNVCLKFTTHDSALDVAQRQMVNVGVFVAEWDASHRKPEPQLATIVQPEAALQLPGNVKLPPMPAGWRPGMPIPGKLS